MAIVVLPLRLSRGDADEANEGSSVSWWLCCPFGLTSGPSADIQMLLAMHGLHPIGHDGQAEMAIRPPSGA